MGVLDRAKDRRDNLIRHMDLLKDELARAEADIVNRERTAMEADAAVEVAKAAKTMEDRAAADGETIPDLPQDVEAMKVEHEAYVANFQRIADLTGEEQKAALQEGWQISRRGSAERASSYKPY
jgi:hypothetical protein